MADSDGNPDNDEQMDHLVSLRHDIANRMNIVRQLQSMGSDLTDSAKATRVSAVKAGTGHNPSSCATCQAYAGNAPA
jgi:hypothetical protein